MGTATALPTQVEQQSAGERRETPTQALITAQQAIAPVILISPNTRAARLPVEVDVAVPVRGFRVRNLLALEPGAVVESKWGHGEDVPLGCGEVQLAWSEFEVVDAQLAVRLTRLV
jgi:flagellar motor switch/type III secretory pathway protein FliN